MPIDITFDTRYQTDGTDLTSGAADASLSFQVTSVNDTVAVGETVTVLVLNNGVPSATSFTAVYQGQTASGELLLERTDNGQQLLVSNDFSLISGDPLPAIESDPLVCFVEGTRIATERGEIAVEDLQPGDRVVTADGGMARVRWVGRQSRSTVFTDAARICPVRISAGALAENVPARDLLVSGDHGIVFDEAIVHASALVNASSITRVAKVEMAARITYYHVETEGHAVILAEGCPAESFIDNLSRTAFDNYAEFEAAYGGLQEDIEPLGLPRAKGPRQVPAAIRARIAARAIALTGPLSAAV